MAYCDVILPVPVEGTFTYLIPEALEKRVGEGFRVIVPFGGNKQYSGIVVKLHNEPPKGDFKVKEVVDVMEDYPLLLPSQLRLWKWMADYYLCPIGDVYKAAVPSGLRLASESVVSVESDFEGWDTLTPKELSVMELLQEGKVKNVAQLGKLMKDSHVISYVRNLMSKGALTVKENISSNFRPRKERHVCLAGKYLDRKALDLLLGNLEKTPKRFQLVMKYVEMAGVNTALSLKNLKLIEEVSRAELLKESEISPAVLIALRSKGILEMYDFEVGRLQSSGVSVTEQLPLTPAQQEAYDDIQKQFTEKPVCLLHGVTSSGKTEIYIRMIRKEIEKGRQVLYLLPEIALTTQIMTRLRRIFGDKMGVYHSKFPDNERVEIWQKQLSKHPYELILGVRSSLFLPFQHLGLVIVDEEHETSYKQEEPAPRYNARDTANVLAAFEKAKTLLGTATPSFESFWNVKNGKYGYVELTKRFGDIMLPKIEVADVKELMRTKQMHPPFSPRLEEEISLALKNGEQVILFQNRRGYAPIVECPKCGWMPTCECCDVTLTYHQDAHRMVCHYCGRSYPLPQACPNCGELHLNAYGYGTEKIEEEVHKRFPKARTARLDVDTARNRSAYENIISGFAEGRTDILIGTQMVSKGLDFDHVHVVGILNADTMMTRPDFRSFERSFQLMSQVAGRAGRRNKQGYVILQTKHPDYTVISQVVQHDYTSMYEEQMEEREAFRYPPFYRLFYIYLKHRDGHVVEQAAQDLGKLLRQGFGNRILGPDRPAIGRLQLMYIRKIALKVERNIPLSRVRSLLLQSVNEIKAQLPYNALQVYFDVDPL